MEYASVEGRTVLVTGAAGFIGSHLVDACLEQGAARVIGLDNFSGGREHHIAHLRNNPRFELCRADIRDYECIEPLVLQSDVVLNDAASKLIVSLKNPRIDLLTNAVGTFNVLWAARKKEGIRVIHASTGSVLGSSSEPMPEDHAKNPATAYGISKLCGENYCTFFAREYGLQVSVLRYFHVFGPRQDFDGEAGVISIFLGRILQGSPPVVFGSGEQIRCFTFVRDVVRANFLLLENKSSIGQIYNVASRTRISVVDLARLLIANYGAAGMEPVFGPPRQGENARPIPLTSKIEMLGFRESISFEEGLELTKQWVEQSLPENRKR